MSDHILLDFLAEHGPLTMAELEKKFGGVGLRDTLCRLKKFHVVHQPKERYWAVVPTQVALLLYSQAKGFALSVEELGTVNDWKRKIKAA